MEIFAYLCSALIGISLGLIGGGGSIMTVPVLVYLFGASPLLATSYSLFIVGSTSLVGAVNNHRKGLVDIKTALLFGLGSITTVFLTRKFLIPLIPAHIARIGNFELTGDILTMVLFAVLMVMAASAMISSGAKQENHKAAVAAAAAAAEEEEEEKLPDLPKLLGYGIAIGLATGVLGAGGGFLLIPALVLLVGLPMKKAIGTSLLIIALNSLIGFTGDLGHFSINWSFLLRITLIAIAGIFIGGYLGRRINGSRLKKGFGWFVLVMGTYIIIKELLLKK